MTGVSALVTSSRSIGGPTGLIVSQFTFLSLCGDPVSGRVKYFQGLWVRGDLGRP